MARDPPGDERPLFITFKPLTEDKAGTKVGLGTTPGLPHGGEMPLGHHEDTDGTVPPSSWLSPPGWSLGEGDLRPELVALRARTRRWFQQTQAKRLVAQGQLPAWFHGFISRRETEELLRDQPPGCFLVRFSETAPEGPHAEGETDPVAPPEPPDAKYQQLLCFHTYAEPREVRAPSAPPSRQLGDPIPFYAMGRGSTSGPEENIYSEVASAGQDLPLSFPRGSPGAFSTLPPKSHPHRRLFRSVSSQAFKGRHLPAAPTTLGKERGASSAAEEGGGVNPSREFDDPVYGRRMSNTGRNGRGRGQEGPENIYEQLLGDQP
ncbi:PREDICTED: SH2 domain-containing protein 2A [Calidris pugnax]|uniref:SH2 domain-containing protein 2A n=1 Tax=Calidris pugnax TaxID=198806 RepID=UPI00071D3B28|nr:PREDICTED: SH2 domain-containing protein 2A [Calidris pugnax]